MFKMAELFDGELYSDFESDIDTNEDDTDTEKPVAKKAKSSTCMKGAATYKTKFKKEWTKKWPFIQDVPSDKYKFICTICRREINCSHQGKADVERHIGKSVHQDNVKLAKSQSTINFVPLSNPLTDKV